MIPLRVGMYTTVGPRCGIASYTASLVGALAAHARVTTIPIQPGSLNPLKQVLAGCRLTLRDLAHIQHTYSFFGIDQLTYTLMIRALFASIRRPIVLTAHTVREPVPPSFEGGLGSRCANAFGAPAWLDARTFQRPDAVIVHAQMHKQRLVARHVEPGRIHVIPPGIPRRVVVPPQAVEAFKARLGVLTGRPLIGVFGFLEASKRFSDLLASVGTLPQRPCVLVAGGPRVRAHEGIQQALTSEAEQLGVADRVVITGYLEEHEVPVALEAMDVVVVPYGTDHSMSYSLHRALGQGRPVVATDLLTMREVQARGNCLHLVQPGDHPALHAALTFLLQDREARERLSSAALEYAAQESVQMAAIRTLEVYACVRKNYR